MCTTKDPRKTWVVPPSTQKQIDYEMKKTLQRLLPGVFLATAAYSDENAFLTQVQPRVLKSTLINVKTPAIYNDTKVPDHFEWQYNTAISQAVAATKAPSSEAFLDHEHSILSSVRGFLNPTSNALAVFAWIPAMVVAKLGKLLLSVANNHTEDMVAAAYRFTVNMVFAFFTVPVFILTHVTYWL